MLGLIVGVHVGFSISIIVQDMNERLTSPNMEAYNYVERVGGAKLSYYSRRYRPQVEEHNSAQLRNISPRC